MNVSKTLKIFSLSLALTAPLAGFAAGPRDCNTLVSLAAKSMWAVNSGVDMSLLDATILKAQTDVSPMRHLVEISSKFAKTVDYDVLSQPIPGTDSCNVVQVTVKKGEY
jgi:hypothetical protein